MSQSIDNHSWALAPEKITLKDDEVHVWRAALDHADVVVTACQRVLTPEENERAKRFVFKRDRDRFIVARSTLRTILGRYAGRDPAQLRFSYAKHGKPSLDDADGLFFNLSHSRSIALYAVSSRRELGIDLEYVRRDLDAKSIAARFFSAAETVALNNLPEDSQIEAFFHCWTRKEAYIKARGEGIYFGLDKFDVSLSPNETAALLRVENSPDELARWSFQNLHVHADYAAAVIGERSPWTLKCWEFSLEQPRQ